MKYNPALDGLRAVAVVAVIAYHSSVPYSGWGVLGVDAFFVLSGYLITSILAAEESAGGIRLGAFYMRRVRRLYPALLALVLALIAVGWASWESGMRSLLYLTDYLRPIDMLAHTWSLSVEEHYYLLWPLLLPFVARMPRRRAVGLLLTIYVLGTLWTHLQPFEYRQAFRFDTRFTGLVFGSMLGLLPERTKLPAVMLALATVGLVVGLPVQRPAAEAATAVIIVLSHRTTLPFLTRPTFVYLGQISYGMYLYHVPFEWISRGWFDMETAYRFGTTMAFTLAAATVSYFTIEAWFRKPKCREPAPQSAIAQSA